MLPKKKLLKCFYDALVDTIKHDGVEHAGYIAFLSLLSFFPFLVFFVATVGFFGQTDLGLKFINILLENDIMPPNVLEALRPRIAEIASGPPQGLLTIAIVGAIWTASSAVEGLRTILNRAYRVSTPPAYIWRRMLSIGQFLILTLAIIVAVFGLVIAPEVWEAIQHKLNIEEVGKIIDHFLLNPAWDYLRYIIVSIILFLIISAIYFIIPNIKQRWSSIAPGAVIVVIAWFISGSLFSGYLRNFEQVNLIYGSLGGIIAALIFFYITAMIFIYGAEFNYRIEKALGNKIEEKEPKK